MKLKLNMVVAALALASTGAANAALDSLANGNSSLVFLAYDRTGVAQGSFLADLNFNINGFLPTSGTALQQIVWNFNANTITVDGVTQSGSTIGWNTTTPTTAGQFSSFLGATEVADTRWGVIAGDNISQRFLTTGAPTTANLADTGTNRQSNQTTSNMVFADDFYGTNNVVGTHGSVDAGASFSRTSDASFFAKTGANGFGTTGNWNGALRWNAVLADGASSKFFYINNVPRGGTGDTAEITAYGNPDRNAPFTVPAANDGFSTFTYNTAAGTLTWNGVSPVPEANAYAMFLAGLGCLGFLARRRRQG
jgi:hypothetical protein